MGANTAWALEDEPLSWQLAHAALSRLARERAAADAEEGRWLLAARRSAVHVHLGFGSFSEYVERLFGYQPRSTRNLGFREGEVRAALRELRTDRASPAVTLIGCCGRPWLASPAALSPEPLRPHQLVDPLQLLPSRALRGPARPRPTAP